jgi:hypothetical protein
LKRTPVVLAALAATAALAFAGCGGDDDEPSTAASGATGASGSIESKDDFVAAADAICAEEEEAGQAEIQEALGGTTTPSQQEQVEIAETVVIPSFQTMHDQIAALPQPEGEEDAINDILDELQAGIDAAGDDPLALIQATEGGPLADAQQAALDYGMTECGA